jgi:hypothetical protein
VTPPGHRGPIAPVFIPRPLAGPIADRTPAPAAAPVHLRREDPPPCPRCGGGTLLSAQIPHHITGGNGRAFRGTIAVALCPTCDLDDAVAAPLIRFFDTHAEVTDDSTRELATLLRTWVDHLRTRTVDPQQLDREYRQWRRGEF